MQIFWSPTARSDFEVLLQQMIELRRSDAYNLCAAVDESVARLAEQPYSGQIGHVTATRELPIPDYPYLVVYTVRPDGVFVLRLMPAPANA